MGSVKAPPDPLAAIAAGPTGPRVGAFFDLDGTLVAGFTATAHAGDRIRQGQARVGEVLGVVEASVRYKLGRMQFDRLLTRAATFLRGESPAELDAVCRRLFDDQIRDRIYPLMRRIVDAHREQGHTVVLSSSALMIHAGPVAGHLGIHHVICNDLERGDDGLLTGRVRRPVVWGVDKAAAVQRFCESNDVEIRRSFFYADGDEDAALMERVGHPRPVNPRAGLAALATRRGWPVLRINAPGSGGGANALGHLPGLGRAVAGRTWNRLTSRGAERR